MKINKIEIFTYPPPRSWMSPVIVRINTDEGISGIGEIALAYGLGGEAGAYMAKEIAAFLVLGELRQPIILVRLRVGGVLRATMPETTVDEHDYSRTWKDNIHRNAFDTTMKPEP